MQPSKFTFRPMKINVVQAAQPSRHWRSTVGVYFRGKSVHTEDYDGTSKQNIGQFCKDVIRQLRTSSGWKYIIDTIYINEKVMDKCKRFEFYWGEMSNPAGSEIRIMCTEMKTHVSVKMNDEIIAALPCNTTTKIIDIFNKAVTPEVDLSDEEQRNMKWVAMVDGGDAQTGDVPWLVHRSDTVLDLINNHNWNNGVVYIYTHQEQKQRQETNDSNAFQIFIIDEKEYRVELTRKRYQHVGQLHAELTKLQLIDSHKPIAVLTEKGRFMKLSSIRLRSTGKIQVKQIANALLIDVEYEGNHRRINIKVHASMEAIRKLYEKAPQNGKQQYLPANMRLIVQPEDKKYENVMIPGKNLTTETIDNMIKRLGYFSVKVEEEEQTCDVNIIVIIETEGQRRKKEFTFNLDETFQDICDHVCRTQRIRPGKTYQILQEVDSNRWKMNPSHTLRKSKITDGQTIVIHQNAQIAHPELEALVRQFRISLFDGRKYTRIDDRVGRGATGSVFKYVNNRDSSDALAVKYVHVESKLDDISNEISVIMNAGEHPCIVSIEAIDIETSKDEIGIVMPYMENTLASLLKTGISATDKARYLMAIVIGMEHLHKKNIIHRDLKPENVLIGTRYNKEQVCICDFAFSKICDNNGSFSSSIGTSFYMAPELINPSGGYKPTKKVDVFAFGCLMYKVLTGDYLLDNNLTQYQYSQQIVSGVRPDIPDYLYGTPLGDMLERCWHGHPQRRPSFSDIKRIFKESNYMIDGEVNPARVSAYVKDIEKRAKQAS